MRPTRGGLPSGGKPVQTPRPERCHRPRHRHGPPTLSASPRIHRRREHCNGHRADPFPLFVEDDGSGRRRHGGAFPNWWSYHRHWAGCGVEGADRWRGRRRAVRPGQPAGLLDAVEVPRLLAGRRGRQRGRAYCIGLLLQGTGSHPFAHLYSHPLCRCFLSGPEGDQHGAGPAHCVAAHPGVVGPVWPVG